MNDESFYSPDKSSRFARLIIGSEIFKTFNSGDAFIGEEPSNPDWIWQLSNLHAADDSGKPKINVTWDQVLTDPNEVIYEGSSVKFPNDFVIITLKELNAGVWRDYILEKSTIELYNST